jgi:tetratricopeptide (TPR) repeat protein
MRITPGKAPVPTRSAWLILLVFLAGASAPCQTVNRSGQIRGVVKDSDGRGIAGVEVVLSADGQAGSLERAITDANGAYILADIAYGAYRVSVSSRGFAEAGPKLVILASATETVDFELAALSGKGAPALPLQNTEDEKIQGPSLGAAGAEGTTAPAGYSTGLSSQETSAVLDDVDSLDREVLKGNVAGANIPKCDREPELLKAAEAKPGAFSPNFELGVFYLGHGDYDRSIKFLKTAIEVSPTNPSAARELALAFLGAKRYPDAVTLLEHVSQTTDAAPSLLPLLAIAYDEAGNRTQSIAAFQRSAALDTSVENQFVCGMGLIGVGASEQAAKLFAGAASSHPDSARLWMGLGVAQDLQQRKLEAIDSLLRAIDIDPAYMPSYSFLAGLADVASDSGTQIRKRLAALVVTHPESAAAHYDYALALWKQRTNDTGTKSFADIVSQLNLALSREPQMARAHFQLGVVYMETGDLRDAEGELQKTVMLEPDDAEAHYRLAQVEERNGQSERAKVEMMQFLVLRGVPGRDENSPETDLRRLGSRLAKLTVTAAPCDGPSH